MSKKVNKLFSGENGCFDSKKYKAWYKIKYPEKYKKYWVKYSKIHGAERIIKERARSQKIKAEVLGYYSGGIARCKKCKVEDLRVLSIDHTNNNGSSHRKQLIAAKRGGHSFYMWLKRNQYPAEYQVLCMNCQFIKRYET